MFVRQLLLLCVCDFTPHVTTPHLALQALTPRATDPSAKKKKGRPAVVAKRPEAKELSADKALPLEEKSKEPIIPSAVVKLSQQIEVSACTPGWAAFRARVTCAHACVCACVCVRVCARVQ